VVCLLTVGFPVEEPEPASRRPLEEMVHYELYGSGRGDKQILPGVPEQVPPDAGEKLLDWLRRLFGRPI
jgi:hypothetical protein